MKTEASQSILDSLLERNLLPDWLIRIGIRGLNRKRIRDESGASIEERQRRQMILIENLRRSPIAVETEAANDQHYELPPKFFELVLGRHRKYSSAYWKKSTKTLDQAEEDMLKLTLERSGIQNGEKILEIGCGWGSLTLFMAAHFPKSKITAISNSHSQRKYINHQAAIRGLKNVNVITQDINSFSTTQKFHRIVSVEMFEHARNYEALFKKVSGMLLPKGTLFVHIFSHRELAYLFESKDSTDWMSRYFFTGGTMPGNHLFLYFASPLFSIENHWIVGGEHYAKTSEAWLKNMDDRKGEVMRIFGVTYGESEKLKWFSYWRIFFLAVAELFATRKGTEWIVSHYLFRKTGR